MKEYLANGERTRPIRRLESDVKALHAYLPLRHSPSLGPAALGISIRVAAGVVEVEGRGGLGGDPIAGAATTGATVEVVVGATPGWEQPGKQLYSRARWQESVNGRSGCAGKPGTCRLIVT